MRPRSSVATPASFNPSCSVLPVRPAAKITVSVWSASPAEVSTHNAPSERVTPATPVEERTRIPRSLKMSARRAEMSASRNGSSRGPRSTSTTAAPSAWKIDAYSHATAPPPTTTRLRRGRSSAPAVSESKTPGSSNGMPGGWKGLEPGARRMASAARTRSGRPSAGRTVSVCSGPRRAVPSTYAMSWRRRFRRTASVINSVTSASRARRRSTSASGRRSRPTP